MSLVVCGRFHYHKYVRLLSANGCLNKFVYSYRINYNFGLGRGQAQNHPLKEYLMYAGLKFLGEHYFYRLLSVLHGIWQRQVLSQKPAGNIAHFLVHGNCYRVMEQYKKRGMVIIGEVVNVHPNTQEALLQKEYSRYGLQYRTGEVLFRENIIKELHFCDHLLVSSSYIKDSLVVNGIPADRIKVLAYGTNERKGVSSYKIIQRNKPIRLLFIGKLTFRKGLIYLLESLQDQPLQNLSISLTVIGSMDKLYQPIIASYLSMSNIKHIDHVDNEVVLDIMQEHDLLVVPSIEDGFGIVAAEALSVKLPVIVTRNCGASEIVKNGKNGFIIEAYSKEEITKAILRSVGYSFDGSVQNASWADYASELVDFYTETIN